MSGRRTRRIAVVGGGISGLAAAHRLHELAAEKDRQVEVVVFEASGRAGGVISTTHRDGFVLEGGPDSLISEKPWAVQLAQRIGLGDRIVGTQDKHRRSFVVRKQRLHPTPEGFELMAPTRFLPLVTTPLFTPLGKLRMAMDLLLPRGGDEADESVGRFVTRRLGREALDNMAQPMITAIYGADPMKLSLRATFPRFLEMEAENRSIILAMWLRSRARRKRMQDVVASGARYSLFVTMDGGLEELVRGVLARLPEGTLRLNCPVRELHVTGNGGGDGGWEVISERGTEAFDAVVVGLPAPQAAPLLRKVDEVLAGKLAGIPYGFAATVSLAYRDQDVSHPLDGFGFVVPDKEGLSLMGCTFAHRKYPRRAPEGTALLRGFHGNRTASLADEDLVEATRRDIAKLLGITVEPMFSHVERWPLSLPHYTVGHLQLVDTIEERAATHRGLALAGNAYRGVGVPDCVRSGEAAAAALADALD